MSIFDKIKRTYDWAISNLYVKPLLLKNLLRNKHLYDSSSYYPDKEARSKRQNFIFQVGQIIKYGLANEFYFMYGLDVKSDEERKEYMNYQPFMIRRNYLNYEHNPHNSTCILRNKLYFDIFANAIGITTPKIRAYYSNDTLYIWNDGFVKTSFDELLNFNDVELFCKETEGECGVGIFRLVIRNNKAYIEGLEISPKDIETKIKGCEYIFQETVCQHPEMSRLYSGSINTMRLVTVRSLKDGEIHIMPSILRIGAHGSFVDNTSQGGLAVGFDLNTGQLHKYGFYKPKFGLRTEVHPDSLVRLNEFYIPMLKDAEEKAIYFHTMLKEVHSIGWDIAIGRTGPIFIEGNDNWEINGPQVGNHGLKKEFEEYFFEK